jgi:vacuolar-type H+-ATPase subunit E/Vma4
MMKRLSDSLQDPKYELITELLNAFVLELNKDEIARRVYAGKNGAYSLLLSVITGCENEPDVLKAALKAIKVLMTGNPDLLDEAGVNLQKRFLKISLLSLY